MSLRTHPIGLLGGLANKPDPLRAGDDALVIADESYYPPGTQSVKKVPGRIPFGSTVGEGANSIHHVSFGGSSLVLVRNGTSLLAADGGGTGTFTAITTSEPLKIAERAQLIAHELFYILIDGTSRAQVLTEALTGTPAHGSKRTRRLGLSPITTPLTLREVASVPGWHQDLIVNATYWYWVTAYHQGNDIEGTYIGTAKPVLVTADTKGVEVTFPDNINGTDATHWRLYRSSVTTNFDRQDTRDAPDLSTGELVATVDMNAGTYIDDAALTETDPELPFSTQLPNEWLTPDNALSSTDGGASATWAEAGLGQAFNEFGFTGISNPIVGIEVEIRVFKTDVVPHHINPRVTCALSWDNGATYTTPLESKAFTFDPQRLIFPGPENLWGHAWTAAELSDANFRVKFVSSGTGYGVNDPSESFASMDWVTVKVYHSGAGHEADGAPFPTVVISTLGKETPFGSHGEPPSSSIGCVFKGSAVYKSGLREIVYSLPGFPDYVPAPYKITFPVPGEEITALVADDTRMIVGFDGHLVRVPRLPRDTNFDFVTDDDRALIPFFGVVGKDAIVACSLDDGNPSGFAFVDRYQGPCFTNGWGCVQLCPRLSWTDMVDEASMDQCILLNYRPWRALILYYPRKGSAFLNGILVLTYHRTADQPLIRPTGPCHLLSSVHAAIMAMDGQVDHLTLDSNGGVWLEHRGNSSGDGSVPLWRIRSAENYPGGTGKDVKIDNIPIHHTGHAALTPLVVRTYQSFMLEGEHKSEESRHITVGRGWIDAREAGGMCMGVSVEIESESASSQPAIDYVAVQWSDAGLPR